MIVFERTSDAFTSEKFEANGSLVAVVLNYNKRGMISKAVECAYAQDYPCYEILAMDDASDDGSREEMLEAVGKCVSEHPEKAVRVTVVTNQTNLTTLGQWRQAVKLSSGRWFGMFCGDDESEPQRMAVAAELISGNPEAVAICTNFTAIGSSEMFREAGFVVRKRGHEVLHDPDSIMGCSAFWRRDVLELPLPDGTMDDFILTWIAIISMKGDLVWDFSRSTVRYNDEVGVTGIDKRGVDFSDNSFWGLCRKYKAISRRGRRFGRNVWDAIKSYDEEYGKDEVISRQVRGHWIASWSEGGCWCERFKAVLAMLVTDRRNDYGGCRDVLLKKTIGRFVTRMLGPVSFATLYWLYFKVAGMRANDR